MRTTLTLDRDVAALLNRVRKARKAGLKEVVNAALREGLNNMLKPPARRTPFSTEVVSLGRCLLPNLDDVSEALAAAEGEQFR